MEASFHLDGKPVRHPLEEKLNASAWAILTAIERSRMAVMNVKGQLAEYYLNLHLQDLLAKQKIQEFEWRLESPDFSVVWNDRPFRIEVKNIRISDKPRTRKGPKEWWVEVQRTRDSKEGKGTRAYKVTAFDALAVCLFNKTGQWTHVFIRTKDLTIRKADKNLLEITQFVSNPTAPPWYNDLIEALGEIEETQT